MNSKVIKMNQFYLLCLLVINVKCGSGEFLSTDNISLDANLQAKDTETMQSLLLEHFDIEQLKEIYTHSQSSDTLLIFDNESEYSEKERVYIIFMAIFGMLKIDHLPSDPIQRREHIKNNFNDHNGLILRSLFFKYFTPDNFITLTHITSTFFGLFFKDFTEDDIKIFFIRMMKLEDTNKNQIFIPTIWTIINKKFKLDLELLSRKDLKGAIESENYELLYVACNIFKKIIQSIEQEIKLTALTMLNGEVFQWIDYLPDTIWLLVTYHDPSGGSQSIFSVKHKDLKDPIFFAFKKNMYEKYASRSELRLEIEVSSDEKEVAALPEDVEKTMSRKRMDGLEVVSRSEENLEKSVLRESDTTSTNNNSDKELMQSEYSNKELMQSEYSNKELMQSEYSDKELMQSEYSNKEVQVGVDQQRPESPVSVDSFKTCFQELQEQDSGISLQRDEIIPMPFYTANSSNIDSDLKNYDHSLEELRLSDLSLPNAFLLNNSNSAMRNDDLPLDEQHQQQDNASNLLEHNQESYNLKYINILQQTINFCIICNNYLTIHRKKFAIILLCAKLPYIFGASLSLYVVMMLLVLYIVSAFCLTARDVSIKFFNKNLVLNIIISSLLEILALIFTIWPIFLLVASFSSLFIALLPIQK